MASTSQSLEQLALEVIRNDPKQAEPLVKLLYAFRNLKSDPTGEIVMDEVIGSLYLMTSHYQESFKAFVSLAA